MSFLYSNPLLERASQILIEDEAKAKEVKISFIDVEPGRIYRVPTAEISKLYEYEGHYFLNPSEDLTLEFCPSSKMEEDFPEEAWQSLTLKLSSPMDLVSHLPEAAKIHYKNLNDTILHLHQWQIPILAEIDRLRVLNHQLEVAIESHQQVRDVILKSAKL